MATCPPLIGRAAARGDPAPRRVSHGGGWLRPLSASVWRRRQGPVRSGVRAGGRGVPGRDHRYRGAVCVCVCARGCPGRDRGGGWRRGGVPGETAAEEEGGGRSGPGRGWGGGGRVVPVETTAEQRGGRALPGDTTAAGGAGGPPGKDHCGGKGGARRADPGAGGGRRRFPGPEYREITRRPSAGEGRGTQPVLPRSAQPAPAWPWGYGGAEPRRAELSEVK